MYCIKINQRLIRNPFKINQKAFIRLMPLLIIFWRFGIDFRSTSESQIGPTPFKNVIKKSIISWDRFFIVLGTILWTSRGPKSAQDGRKNESKTYRFWDEDAERSATDRSPEFTPRASPWGGPLEDQRSLTSIKQKDLVDYLTQNGSDARQIPYTSRNPTSPLNDLEAPP